MSLFDIPVLVRLTRLRFLPMDLVMSQQQTFIGSCEFLSVAQVVDRRTHPVRSMLERNAA
jgi:hypothetical protein